MAEFLLLEEPTTELYIPTVLQRESCKRHKKPVGVPCFHIPIGDEDEGYRAGICNTRAERAGMKKIPVRTRRPIRTNR